MPASFYEKKTSDRLVASQTRYLCVTEGGAVIQQSRKLPGSQKYALLEDRMAKSEGKEILNIVILYIIEDQFVFNLICNV